MALIAVGKFVGVFGVRGELKCKPSPVGELTLKAGGRYALSADGGGERVTLADVRHVGGRPVVRLEGIETVEAAAKLVGREVFVEREHVVLGRGEYLDEDLIGLRLIDRLGSELGRVIAVEHYPAQDCLVLDGRRGLVPMVRAFIQRIDLGDGTILVTLPEGLLER